jgi:pyruvate dehydrogenase (quinone)
VRQSGQQVDRCPDRPLLALLGDGAMQMNGVNELITVAKYWREWVDPRFVVLVLNNREPAFVSWEQRSTEGTPEFDAGQMVPDVDHAGWARSLGLAGARVEDPAGVGPACDAAGTRTGVHPPPRPPTLGSSLLRG